MRSIDRLDLAIFVASGSQKQEQMILGKHMEALSLSQLSEKESILLSTDGLTFSD